MAFGHRSARRRGMLVGAAVASSRGKRREAAALQQAQAVSPATQPASTASADSVKLLKELADLRDHGVLTEEEFSAKKKQILGL